MTDLKQAAREKAQRAVDRNIAARAELDSSNHEIEALLLEVDQAEDETVAFINAYKNPAVENPAPLVPEIAAPAPVEEPPVFTDVASPVLSPDDTSGGFAAVVAEEFVLPSADAPAE